MESEEKKSPEVAVKDEPPVRTTHTLSAAGKLLSYTATAGTLPLKNAQGETEAQVYFTAYTVDEPDGGTHRPLTFVFNGGPGSASIWLHLGAIGPRRVKMQDEGWMPAPPYQLEDNAHTWLDQTDLVFVDPVGTGYSRATKPEYNKKFWNVKGDLESMAEFIRLFLVRYGRWSSPLYLAGESYGTTRSAGLAGLLVDKGIALNGIVLISTVLNFQTLHFDRGNDLPYPLYLPTYAATAWYHKKLAKDLLARPLRDVLDEVEAYALGDYTVALMKGSKLTASEKTAVAKKVARYTGLSTKYIELSNLRPDILRFCKELRRDEGITVGRLDSRFTGEAGSPVAEVFEFDPSLSAIMPPYTAMMNHYTRHALKYETDLEYHALSFEVNRGWEQESGRYVDTSDALRSAFAKNPFMRVLVTQGYYDLATPHMGAEYHFTHMDLPAASHDNVKFTYYEAGHMFYLYVDALAQFRADVRAFLAGE